MFLSLSSAVFAADNISTEEMRLNAFALELQESIPNSEVRVVDGVLHIVVDDPSDIPGFVPSGGDVGTMVTSVTSSIGGSFRGFDPPWSMMTSFAPYSQVYMSETVVNTVLLKLNNPNVYDWILDQGTSHTISWISAQIKVQWNIDVPPEVIAKVLEFGYFVIKNIPSWSIESAQEASSTGKVSIVRGTIMDPTTGTMSASNIYSPWNNNTCTTYAGLDATWHNGVYDMDM